MLTASRPRRASAPFVHGRRRRWTLAGRIFALQLAVVTLVVLASAGAVVWHVRTDTRADATTVVTDVALSVAGSPDVREALTARDAPPGARAVVAGHAEEVRTTTGTDFVTVMDTSRTRWSHPDPAEIGRTFIGHAEAALAGGRVVETYTGTLGPSVRAVVPVRAAGTSATSGPVVGAVAVGITTRSVTRELTAQLPVLLGAVALALLLSVLGSLALSRWVRRRTHGMEPADLTRAWEVNDAVLHSLREGLVVLDPAGRVQVVNDEARRLLPAGEDGVVLPPAVRRLVEAGEEVADDLQVTDDRVLLVNHTTAHWEGRRVGTVLTLRDHTELQALTRDLDAVRGLADALRSQAHEAANRLHVVVTLVEQGRADEAVRFATAELTEAQQLTDLVVADVADPAVAALLIGKSAQAAERGVELEVEPGTSLAAGLLPARDLVTVLGNLLDNAVEAALGGEEPRWVRVEISAAAGPVEVRVTDSGPGFPAEGLRQAMRRGWSRKEQVLTQDGAHGRGLGLALVGQVVRRHGGRVEVVEPVTVDDGGGTVVVVLPVPVPASGPAPVRG
ncbi:sensor histidine kinase [Kineococcus rubinsiae]|uniref:sensor histidine kinase n=1 Tax=Kineococcus rubinsiae TaxID=2609562 RepID=UPI0014317CBB|nr:ATP-binding protein [Kineococcus rubinsiae]NIZ91544.1 GHKL domain-containing protein [Kineococcus rubinsiae]